jgi:hypothetical protein
MGSVGDISAPKSKQLTRVTLNPMAVKIHFARNPSEKVDIRVPIVANEITVALVSFNCAQLTCNDPAKSKKHKTISNTK